jgi:hypothetical protein
VSNAREGAFFPPKLPLPFLLLFLFFRFCLPSPVRFLFLRCVLGIDGACLCCPRSSSRAPTSCCIVQPGQPDYGSINRSSHFIDLSAYRVSIVWCKCNRAVVQPCKIEIVAMRGTSRSCAWPNRQATLNEKVCPLLCFLCD